MENGRPMRAVDLKNMDTGARQGGRLTIMDVRIKEYWQGDLVEELYENPNFSGYMQR